MIFSPQDKNANDIPTNMIYIILNRVIAKAECDYVNQSYLKVFL